MTTEPTALKACCRCGKSVPLEDGKIILVKSRGGSKGKRFYCATCAAGRCKRLTPINTPVRSFPL